MLKKTEDFPKERSPAATPSKANSDLEKEDDPGDVMGYDVSLHGWGWVRGTAVWIEPTAYAILSLLRGGEQHDLVEQGRALIRDRQGADGGWNYGNPKVLGSELQSHALTTAWALLALPSTFGLP